MCRAWMTCTSSTAAVALAISASTQQVLFAAIDRPAASRDCRKASAASRAGPNDETLCLDVGVLDGEREDVGIERPVPDETRLERVQLPDFRAIRQCLEVPFQRLGVPFDGLRRLLGFTRRRD